jgi:plasmid stabilization system protein ParE
MKYKFIYTREAEHDLENAIDWYLKNAGKTVATRLEAFVEATKNLLEDYPGLAKPYEAVPGVYKRPLPKFPYTFYMLKHDDEYEIIAFAFHHQSRDPEKLKKLLQQRISES